ncbi:tRNA-splicing endonuclease subunit sen34 [Xylariales sp. PMI_506]|nr:tRNA-splicing endonuclease subunit sen34 [Xylariales sp. PMI_506]
MAAETVPRLPIRISKLTDRYLLFDIDDVMYLRRHHNICSPFVGTMPQAPQQNVFLGLPIELMPEEAKLLVGKKVAYVVDDSVFHPLRIAAVDSASRAAYLGDLKRDGTRVAVATREYAEFKKAQAVHKNKGKKENKKQVDSAPAMDTSPVEDPASPALGAGEDVNMFDTSDDSKPAMPKQAPQPPKDEAWPVTPITSGALLPLPPDEDTWPLIETPRGYPLYAHLQDNGYYMMPGIRFGCDYNVYPGDPLRFHSHFQATHYAWDEEIKLLDLVTGGRLGTNVKKAYLIGGEIPSSKSETGRSSVVPPVRAFSIEWAAM